MTFFEFLVAAAEQASVSSEPWRDIGIALRNDQIAPRNDQLLYAYLKERICEEELVEEAWHEYLIARCGP